MQCPRCLRVFDAPVMSCTAIAATTTRRGRPSVKSESLTSLPTPRLRKSFTPVSVWFGAAFILALVANIALLALFGYEFMQREAFVPRDPNFQLSDFVNQVTAQALALTYLTLLLWCITAGHTAGKLNASELMTPTKLFLGLVCCPIAPLMFYVHLQYLWKSGDPLAIHEPQAWRTVRPSWMIRAYAILCIAVVASIIFGGIFADGRINPGLGLFIIAGMIAACVLMIVIVFRICRRQYERYVHLDEEPP
jgi:hypothetical protein